MVCCKVLLTLVLGVMVIVSILLVEVKFSFFGMLEVSDFFSVFFFFMMFFVDEVSRVIVFIFCGLLDIVEGFIVIVLILFNFEGFIVIVFILFIEEGVMVTVFI